MPTARVSSAGGTWARGGTGAGSAPDVWDVLKYQYNGLHWRTKERRVLGAGGDGSDTTRWQYYSGGWQLLLEAVGTEMELTSGAIGPADPRARLEQQVWGLRGTDDAILKRWKNPPGGGGSGDIVLDPPPGAGDSTAEWQGYYQLTDSSFSVVAHADYVSGQVRQRMSYDAYGILTVLSPLDFDGDGSVTEADEAAFEAAFVNGTVASGADVNGDGVVDGADKEWYGQRWDDWVRRGWTPDEVRIGYGGYVRDPVSGLMLARNRWYDPVAGRWISRDPAGYVDGLDLYL